jgi:hypothetical protein
LREEPAIRDQRIFIPDTTIGFPVTRGVTFLLTSTWADALPRMPVVAPVSDSIRLPIPIPPQAVALQGLRIGKGSHRADLPCFLAYCDQEGSIHEVRIGFLEMIEILDYLNETGQSLPLRVRFDS